MCICFTKHRGPLQHKVALEVARDDVRNAFNAAQQVRGAKHKAAHGLRTAQFSGGQPCSLIWVVPP